MLRPAAIISRAAHKYGRPGLKLAAQQSQGTQVTRTGTSKRGSKPTLLDLGHVDLKGPMARFLAAMSSEVILDSYSPQPMNTGCVALCSQGRTMPSLSPQRPPVEPSPDQSTSPRSTSLGSPDGTNQDKTPFSTSTNHCDVDAPIMLLISSGEKNMKA